MDSPSTCIPGSDCLDDIHCNPLARSLCIKDDGGVYTSETRKAKNESAIRPAPRHEAFATDCSNRQRSTAGCTPGRHDGTRKLYCSRGADGADAGETISGSPLARTAPICLAVLCAE
jgi:hypothetical protein